jgi:ABC-type phosphate transport system substrate-binding protein
MRTTSATIKFLLSAVLVLVLANGAAAQPRSVAVAVSPKNPVLNLTLGELRKIFSGEKRTWQDGSRVRLFSRASGTIERTALLKLLGKSETEYKQYWTGKIYQGDAEAEPMVLPSNGMQKEALMAYSGAITLVDAAEVKLGMKILKVDGKMPEEEGYPLHP